MLVHRSKPPPPPPPSILSGCPDNFPVPIYSWVKRGTVRVKCLAQMQWTQTARSGTQRADHWSTASPKIYKMSKINIHEPEFMFCHSFPGQWFIFWKYSENSQMSLLIHLCSVSFEVCELQNDLWLNFWIPSYWNIPHHILLLCSLRT